MMKAVAYGMASMVTGSIPLGDLPVSLDEDEVKISTYSDPEETVEWRPIPLGSQKPVEDEEIELEECDPAAETTQRVSLLAETLLLTGVIAGATIVTVAGVIYLTPVVMAAGLVAGAGVLVAAQ